MSGNLLAPLDLPVRVLMGFAGNRDVLPATLTPFPPCSSSMDQVRPLRRFTEHSTICTSAWNAPSSLC